MLISNITNSLPKITRDIWKTATAKKIKEVMVSVVFLLTSPSLPPTDNSSKSWQGYWNIEARELG